MARNQEKAALMFNRWTAMKEGFEKEESGRGGGGDTRRPFLASDCKVLPEAEKWRRTVIHDITKKIAEIQNAGLGEARIRDLNDEINKHMREKIHWDKQIKALGGPDYALTAPQIAGDAEGRELPGARGYKYFGAARDLAGIRELFEEAAAQAAARNAPRLRRGELMKAITPDYYGFRDEDDGVLLPLEAAKTMELRAQLHEAWILETKDQLVVQEKQQQLQQQQKQKEASAAAAVVAAPMSLADVEKALNARAKQLLVEKYASSSGDAQNFAGAGGGLGGKF